MNFCRYNSLPDDGNQPQISEIHLQAILNLILACGVKDKFGVHLIHGHLQLQEGKIMLGKTLSRDVRGVWTRPNNIINLDPKNIHSHIFALNLDGHFTAYKYHEGALPVLKQSDLEFTQFAALLKEHRLADFLGLQVLAGHEVKRMQEFDLSGNSPEGVVMLVAEDTNVDEVYRVTGWSAKTDKSTGVTKLKGNDIHSQMQNGNHKIFQDSKLADEKSLIEVLKCENIIP